MAHPQIDGYTGYYWCGAGLHLLVPENATARGRCRACATARKRNERKKKGGAK